MGWDQTLLHGTEYWPAARPVNFEMPRGVPVNMQGDLPVIAHLVWETHEELIPGRAIRWTEKHVMVMVRPVGAPSQISDLSVWLRIEDVFSTIPRRPPGHPGRQSAGRSARGGNTGVWSGSRAAPDEATDG